MLSSTRRVAATIVRAQRSCTGREHGADYPTRRSRQFYGDVFQPTGCMASSNAVGASASPYERTARRTQLDHIEELYRSRDCRHEALRLSSRLAGSCRLSRTHLGLGKDMLTLQMPSYGWKICPANVAIHNYRVMSGHAAYAPSRPRPRTGRFVGHGPRVVCAHVQREVQRRTRCEHSSHHSGRVRQRARFRHAQSDAVLAKGRCSAHFSS